MRLVPATVVAVLLTVGCSQGMDDQPKYEAQEAAPGFPQNQAAQPLAEGVVPWSAEPPADPAEGRYTMARLQRGRERFDIYCAPCHGRTGAGDGMVVQRGFPPPPSLVDRAARALPDHYLYQVASEGVGRMYGQAAWIPAADRWSIVAYLRALQLSQNAALSELDPALAERVREALP